MIPCSISTSVITTPWRASEGAVLKNNPLSSAVESPGDVADGEIMTTPLASATLARIAPVTPEQSAPMIPFTPSDVIKRSAAAVAAAASIHVLSARTEVTEAPPNSFPLSVTSFMANSAPSPIGGVRDSIGPVNPRITPILIFEWPPANAVDAIIAVAAVTASSFFIFFLPKKILSRSVLSSLGRK